jgi:hypothetical protein
LIFSGRDSHYFVDLAVDLLYLLFRPLLAGLGLHFFNLHASEGVGAFVLHVILCVLALLALAVTVALGPVVVTLTVLLQAV